jgi:arylsulfate sulfotransferase
MPRPTRSTGIGGASERVQGTRAGHGPAPLSPLYHAIKHQKGPEKIVMQMLTKGSLCLIGLLGCLSIPAAATVRVTAFTPSAASPQPIGTAISWTVNATDTNPGPLAFQFNIETPGGTSFALIKDFNNGAKKKTVWVPPAAFNWTPTGVEGTYKIQVVVEDFTSGEMAKKTVVFKVTPLATAGMPVVVATGNPLVALFDNPPCPVGSTVRVSFAPQSGTSPGFNTPYANCTGTTTNTFEIAGMYANTAYNMFAQVVTGGTPVNGPPVAFTTGVPPSKIPFPTFTTLIGPGPNTDTIDSVVLHGSVTLGGGELYPEVATDLSNNVLWYSYSGGATGLLTRPLANGTTLAIESGPAWNGLTGDAQLLRQRDLAGNIVHETNTGILQQLLPKIGAVDAGPCTTIPSPAPQGSACLGAFHHDAIQSLANGYTAVLGDIEKIFPPNTQGDPSTLPVDIIGDIIIVLDTNWQPVWYFDTFDHITGTGQLDITRAAIGGNTCIVNEGGCPPIFLLSSGIAPKAHDWLHANSMYYSPVTHDIIWSSRHQDWIMRIDYQDGNGTGDLLWRMGLDGDFTFNNTNGDPYPWFSHQHEVAMENNGAGPMSLYDNGNTRISALGSSGCKPNDCNSRGMVLTVDETNLIVTPVLSQDLGRFSEALGSAQLLSNGNYFFESGFVIATANSNISFSIEIQPTTGVNGNKVLNIKGPEAYRGWQMPDMYTPPIS